MLWWKKCACGKFLAPLRFGLFFINSRGKWSGGKLEYPPQCKIGFSNKMRIDDFPVGMLTARYIMTSYYLKTPCYFSCGELVYFDRICRKFTEEGTGGIFKMANDTISKKHRGIPEALFLVRICLSYLGCYFFCLLGYNIDCDFFYLLVDTHIRCSHHIHPIPPLVHCVLGKQHSINHFFDLLL